MSTNLLCPNSMAALVEKKIALDVAADRCSAESLSFSGLICIHDQHSKFQSGLQNPLPTISDASQIQKQDTDFEFGRATPEPATDDRNNKFPADVLFFKGELRPQAVQSQSNYITNSSTVTHNRSKRAKNSNSVHWNIAVEEKIQANKKTAANPSFGWKIFSSLVSPCRECHATEPSIKKHSVPRKDWKSE